MSEPAQPAAADTAAAGVAALGRSRGWTITLGVLTLIIGILIMAWPGATLLVIGWLFGLQLLIAGIFRLVAAFAMDDAQLSGRFLFALLGILLIVVGILCLRAPFQTVGVLALLLGLVWTVGGVIELFHAFGHDVPSRGWAITSGALSVIAGIIVLVYPISSAVALSWLVGILLAALGIVAICTGIFAGSSRSAAAATTGVPRPAAS